MSASRKDYQAIADALARTRPEADTPSPQTRRIQWEKDVAAVARALHDTGGLDRNGNRRFDTDRFVAACKAVK